MIHLFKVPLEHSDMFIRSLDLKTQLIEYQVFGKDGKPMEPLKEDKFIINEDTIIFDKSRFINLEYATYIAETLNS